MALENPLQRRSQEKTLDDEWVDEPEPLFLPKKGRHFGKSHASNFVWYIPGKILTEEQNY